MSCPAHRSLRQVYVDLLHLGGIARTSTRHSQLDTNGGVPSKLRLGGIARTSTRHSQLDTNGGAPSKLRLGGILQLATRPLVKPLTLIIRSQLVSHQSLAPRRNFAVYLRRFATLVSHREKASSAAGGERHGNTGQGRARPPGLLRFSPVIQSSGGPIAPFMVQPSGKSARKSFRSGSYGLTPLESAGYSQRSNPQPVERKALAPKKVGGGGVRGRGYTEPTARSRLPSH